MRAEIIKTVLQNAFPKVFSYIRNAESKNTDSQSIQRYNELAGKFNLDMRFVMDKILNPMPSSAIHRNNYLAMADQLITEGKSALPAFSRDKAEGIRIMKNTMEGLDWLVSSCFRHVPAESLQEALARFPLQAEVYRSTIALQAIKTPRLLNAEITETSEIDSDRDVTFSPTFN